ncbi:hypothetical protein [Nonomuraea sp. NPDC046570]|uniref:hypothetical protein n=1 Tax=Nonomuraea sp. NPDC046570 TaxID=3155255 RepID=UPI0033E880B1
MKRMTTLAVGASLSMALVSTLAPAVSATARIDTVQGRCSPRFFYKVHRLSPRNFFIPRTRYIDGPGGEMTVSITREHEVLAFLETEKERTRQRTKGDLVRSLRQLGIPHLEERHMVFSGHDYTRTITKGKYGNMWYRVFGYRIGYSTWRVLGTCRRVRVGTGIANVPARVEGWRYWETDHPIFRGRRIFR